MTMKNQINLGNKVVISDPCYTIPTWCQEVIDGVKPGKYNVFAHKLELDMWGERVCALVAIHEDHEITNIYFDHHSDNVGVDSGQAGIFDIDTYRKDELTDQMGLGDGDITFFGDYNRPVEEGEKWYETICSRTLGVLQWGVYDRGVVSSSGIGDGSYSLYTATVDEEGKEIVGFIIDFGIDGDLFENLEEVYNEIGF
jgi:hypothetical protein